MKSIILINIFCLLAMGCTKQKNQDAGYPLFYKAHFQFLSPEAKPVNSVEISNQVRLKNNEWVPYGIDLYFLMLQENALNNGICYGPVLLGVNVEETIKYRGQPLSLDHYFLIRLENKDLDTFLVKEYSRINSENNLVPDKYETYYNGKLTNTFNAENYSGLSPWIISVQK